MKMHIKVIIVGVAFVVTAFFPPVWALSCYNCTGIAQCNSLNVPSVHGCTVCTKLIEGGTLTKGCGKAADAEFCFESAARTTCVCYVDYCNHVSNMRPSFWTIIAIILACFGMYIHI
ncbi:hypothetical protein DPMN_141145 [Dreissena polymorpha]|uniref:Uncharacterized protein n=1 Tax=Dreissena polymorpha TaxID=45954 RepID=A0A9D4JMC6_DREPO|nr:hypothetical protein DPMN_141145 [Dreissena polymorpha]